MRKILFHLNCLELGGAERVVSNLANRFAGTDFAVVIATEWQSEAEYELCSAVRRIHVGLRPADMKKSRIMQVILRIKYLRALIKAEKPDVVIAFDRNANYRALMAAKKKITPVIISIRNPPFMFYDTWKHKAIVAIFFPRAAGCVFQTAGQRDFFPAQIQRKSRIILNPLNPKYIGAAPPKERRKEIVHSSRLVDFKNQAGILRAFIRIHSDYPEYILKLYGGDSGDGTKEILEKIIAENDAAGYIRLMGASDALEKELVSAALFVFNSDWEGLPNALMEAMALGLPVIATDCPSGGPAEIITDGVNGLLIPIKDDAALESAIRRLLADPEYAETLGAAARRISERCNIEIIAAQWRDYINEVCC